MTGLTVLSDVAISGVIGDGGHGYELLKLGGGSLTLSGVNTYSGDTKVYGGILELATSASLRSGTISVTSGGTLGGWRVYAWKRKNITKWEEDRE